MKKVKSIKNIIDIENIKDIKKSKLLLSLRIIITLCAAYGWWGVLYPEFTMTTGTYRVVYEDSAVQEDTEVVECEFDDSIYETILKSDRSRIRLRSKLLVNLTALKEQERGIHDSRKK